jgi:uncharacterized protein YodC (DUF2158 family)
MALKVGDVVILKSGGPTMTVHGIGDYSMKGLNPGVLCVWFDKNTRVEDVFHPDSLEPYKMHE